MVIDTGRPNLARCYDALLGGKDNYEVDRRFCAQLLAVAQAINADARVVYVDNDPVVRAHGRALLVDNDRTHFVAADFMLPGVLCGAQPLRQLGCR